MTDLHQRNGDTKESIDYVLLILVLLLVVFGLVVLYSTSAYNAGSNLLTLPIIYVNSFLRPVSDSFPCIWCPVWIIGGFRIMPGSDMELR